MGSSPSQAVHKIILAILILLLFRVALKYLLPWSAPFLIAFAFAALMEPSVRRMSSGALSRGLSAGVCTLLLFGTLASLLILIGSRVGAELTGAAGRMPELFDNIMLTAERLELWARDVADGLPAGIGRWITDMIDNMPDHLGGIPAWLSGKAVAIVSAVAEKTPSVLLFTLTTGIGVYFFSASYPDIVRFVSSQIPENQKPLMKFLRTDLLRTVACWLRAQFILMAITFGELLIALTALEVEYALAVSLLIALIDMLPVFGTGTVLIPWAAISLVGGNIRLGIGVIIAYGVITLLRNLIQAKLLGDSLGLHPAATLVAIYLGFCVMGIGGMILFPVATIMLKQLNDNGFVHLWKSGGC